MLAPLFLYLKVATGRVADRVTDDDRGATAVEYGLMVALIAAVIVGTVTALGTNLDGLFSFISGEVSAPAGE